MRSRQERIDKASADWFARMANERRDAPRRAEFREWRNASAAHRQAHDRHAALWAELGELSGHPDMARLRAETRKVPEARRLPRVTGGLGLAACLCLAALVISMVTAEWGQPRIVTDDPLYHLTAEGERLTVSLPDRSEVSLAPLSAITVAYSDDARQVRLVEGLAYFSVATDVERPFRVTAGERDIVVTGTEFQVALSGDWPVVVLAEGEVEVSARSDAEAAVHRLSPGQRLGGAGSHPVIDIVDVDAETAWRSGQLVFRDTPLGEVVLAFNRHAREPIEVADDAAASVRVSGVFHYQQVNAFVAALESTFELSAERGEAGGYVIRSREASR